MEEILIPENKNEDEFEKIMMEMLESLRGDFQALNEMIDFKETNPRKLALVLNSRARISQQILYCIAMMRDPKLKLSYDSGRKRDFAKMIEKVLPREVLAISKSKDDSSNQEEKS
jgi:hypothetical protein